MPHGPQTVRITAAITTLCAVLLALAAGCTPSTSTATSRTEAVVADYPQFRDVTQLINTADVVAVVEYVDSSESLLYPTISSGGDEQTNPQADASVSPEDLEKMAVPVTLAKVKVIETLKGGLAPGQDVTFSQTGGTVGGTKVREASTALLSESLHRTTGKRFLLILEQQPNETFTSLNPELGTLGILDNDVLVELTSGKAVSKDAAQLVESQRAGGLTVDDVRALAQSSP